MPTRFAIYSLVAISISCSALCQTDPNNSRTPQNQIRVNLGLAHTRLVDEGYTDSRLAFRSTPFQFNIGYHRQVNKSVLDFDFKASFAKMKSVSGDLPSDYAYLEPSLSYRRIVHSSGSDIRQTQASIGLHLSSMNVIMDNQPIFDNLCITSLHGLYVSFREQIQFHEKQVLVVKYLLPAIVYTNRIVWNGGASNLTYSDEEHILRTLTTRGSYSYFDVLDNIQLTLEYRLKIGPATDFNVAYSFFYFDSEIQRPVRAYSNTLLTGFTFSF